MINLFYGYIQARKPYGGIYTYTLALYGDFNKDEATGRAIRECKGVFPIVDGWQNHVAIVTQISESHLGKFFAGFTTEEFFRLRNAGEEELRKESG